MSPYKAKPPTYDEIAKRADRLRTVTGPVPAADLVEQMLAARPSQAKNPRQAMRQRLREAVGRLLVFVDADTVLPLRLAFQGVRFRLPLDRDTRTRPTRPAPGTPPAQGIGGWVGGGGASVVSRGLLDIGDSLPSYLPLSFPVERVRFMDSLGQPIAFQTRKLSEKVDSPFGRTTIERLSADVGSWFRAEQVGAKDWLLFTIVDWEQGIIQLERESLSQYDPVQRAARNRLLADLFYELLEGAADEQIDVHDAVPTVYARLPEKEGYPPDHWAAVLAADERLTTDGWGMIRYRDGGPSWLLERLVPDWFEEPRRVPSQPVSKEQGAQVYRFRAALARRQNLWRTIEIQGKQSLVDLDRALRGAFQHDTWDHLGGFWKLVPRGAQARSGGKQPAARRSRYREVELGDVDPEGGGTGAKVKVAELGLVVGDQLKYIYDFGDWIEHRLTREAIAASQPRVKYPREVGRNQPQYANCIECQKKGRRTVAKWICLECSNRRDEDILLCAACAQKRHEEHYLDEILY